MASKSAVKRALSKDFIRLWQCLFPQELTQESLDAVRHVLNENEYKVFMTMNITDRQHCYDVYQGMLVYTSSKNIPVTPYLSKAVLLHDIGKSYLNISLYDRIVVGLYNKLPAGTRGKMLEDKLFSGFNLIYKKSALHATVGAAILVKHNIDNIIVSLVRHHHDRDICFNSLGIEGQVIYIIDNTF